MKDWNLLWFFLYGILINIFWFIFPQFSFFGKVPFAYLLPSLWAFSGLFGLFKKPHDIYLIIFKQLDSND